ncbi:MAG: PA14 domain-containing protein, partial [Kiritimatiellaeota bacterium]|nr:PA14 domain-containing protein [Kiritimatiellota bacterium]
RLTVDQTQGGGFSGEVRLGPPPASAVAALDPLIWWDPSDTATVTLSGGRVIGLVNKGVGGGAFDAVVRTSVPGFVGPTYVTGINSYSGLPMLRIDTNGQGLESASSTGISGNAPRTLIAVTGRAVNNATLDVTLGTGANNQRFGLLHNNDGQTLFPTHGNDIAMPGQAAGTPAVLSAYNGVGGYLYTWQGFVNGFPSAPKTSTAMNTLNTPLYIGYLFNSTATVSERGQVGEVLLFDRALTPAERELVDAYLIAKWRRTGVGTLGVDSTELVKAGAGTWTLDNPGTMFGGTFRQTEGETVLKGASLLGEVSVEGGTGLTFAPAATNGLMGYYYDFYPATPSAFLTVEGVEGLIAGRVPVLISPSGLDNSAFAYPVTGSAGLLFPYPFGGGGPNTVNFIAVWRGSITVPETGIYGFRMVADDHALLALDGTPVISITTSTSDTAWVCRSAELTAGRHDILIGLEQGAGNAGIRLSVCEPSSLTGAYVPVPNSWLTPMSTVGAIDHLAGQVTVQGGANVRIGEKGPGTLVAALDIGAGGLLEKSGNNRLEIKGGAWNQVEGDVSVRAGRLALTDPDWSAPDTRMAVHDGATLFLTSHGTVGGLSGKGLTLIGSEGVEGVDMFPFTDETDSGISTEKNYTHLVDLPLTQATIATVNGVTFNTGSANWSYVAGTTPTASQSADTEVGITRLLRGFLFGQTDYTFRLTGLKPFTAHEFRLYNRNYSNGNRDVTYTFTAGANLVGDIRYNVDSITRSQVRCRYITDAAGTLDVRVYSHVGSDTCHFYAFSNEVFRDPAATGLTVDSPAGSDTRYEGIITGSGGLVKSGDGTQRFSGAINLDGAFTIGGGETVLECGATVKGAPEVEASATLSTPIGGVTLGGITGNGTLKMSNPEGNLYRHFFTNDVGSLISPTKVYTHKLDFGSRGGITAGSPGAIVNDVEFVKAASSGTANGYGWSGFGSQTHAGNANTGIPPTTEKAHALMTDMVYNTPTGTATLTGLTPGKQYELRIYNRMWTPGEWRGQEVIFSPGPGPTADTRFFQDQMALHFLAYRYTSTTDTLTISYNNFGPAATWHFYALTNEELTNEDWNSVVFDMADDSVFNGTVTGHQHWTKRGAGTLLMTGVNTATGPLTVESGAFGVGVGGVATEGPVSVMDGALLFGQGTVGGAVGIADGAWIQAGEAGVCGTLTIGGDLFLAESANIAFRYGSTASADTFLVGGVLTLPQNGVIYSAPLVPGTPPPSRWTLFATAGIINGPPDLSGWTIDGLPRAKLTYSANKKRVDIITSEGTILMIR